MPYLGELAALVTSMAYAVNSTLFTAAGRLVGSTVVNRIRLLAACFYLTLGHWIFLGSLWPVQAGRERWMWLGLSGIVGLVVGDAMLFQAFVWIGPRLSMLMMSLAPLIAAGTAWAFLGERLNPLQIGGILTTLLGVGWVILDRDPKDPAGGENYYKGILFGLGAAAGQGLGVVLAKPGLGGGFSPLSGNFIRMFSALLVLGAVTVAGKKVRETIAGVRQNPRALWAILGGAFSGPFIGVSLSLYALQHTSIGVASTLMALPPIFLLPVETRLYGGKIGWRAILGTVLALLGVGMLFLF